LKLTIFYDLFRLFQLVLEPPLVEMLTLASTGDLKIHLEHKINAPCHPLDSDLQSRLRLSSVQQQLSPDCYIV